jgi:hypothetical protein
MNTYSTQFTVPEPDSGHPVRYTFTVRIAPQLVVDAADLVAAGILLAKKPRRPEDVADFLRGRFPGKHTLRANHFGVAIKLQRVGTA